MRKENVEIENFKPIANAYMKMWKKAKTLEDKYKVKRKYYNTYSNKNLRILDMFWDKIVRGESCL